MNPEKGAGLLKRDELSVEESAEHPGGDARQATVLLRAIQQQNPRDAIEPKVGGLC